MLNNSRELMIVSARQSPIPVGSSPTRKLGLPAAGPIRTEKTACIRLRLVRHRTALGLSQKEAAQRLGVESQYVGAVGARRKGAGGGHSQHASSAF